jgi:hypothetical protein
LGRDAKLAYFPAVTYSFLASFEDDLLQTYAPPDRQIAVDFDALGHIGPGSSGHVCRIASRLLQAKTVTQSRRTQL